jgi:predicted dinucleotide-binding enzyme
MKVGIIGSGVVGLSLAEGFIKHGYNVQVGTEKNRTKVKEWALGKNLKCEVGNFAQAAQYGELIVLAVPGKAAKEALALAMVKNLKQKTIIDANNPIESPTTKDGVLEFFTGQNDSLMEQLQNAFPEAHFVKAFNSVGAHLMVNPDFGGVKPTMFICGNSEAAKQIVTKALDQFGWEVWDMGSAVAARAIEPLCKLWCIPGFKNNRWSHAFKMLKRD